MDELKRHLTTVVRQTLGQAGLEIEVTSDLSLMESGLLDSLSVVVLAQRLQETFDIDVDVADVTLGNFDSVDALAAFVFSRTPAL